MAMTIEDIEKLIKDIQAKIPGITSQIQKMQVRKDTRQTLDKTGDIPAATDLTYPAAGVPPQERLEGTQELIDRTRAAGTAAVAGAGAEQEYWTAMQKRMEELSKQISGAETQRKGWFEKYFAEKPDIAGELERLRTQYKVPEYMEQINTLIPEIGALNEQIATLEGNRNQAILAAEQRLAGYTKGVLRGEEALIQRQYDSRISSLAAQSNAKIALMNAYKGQMDTARSFVNETVQALMYDTEQNRQNIRDAMDFYGDQINDMKSEYKDILTSAQDYWETRAKEEKEDYDWKLDLMIDAANKGVNIPFGDVQNMSREELARTYSEFVAPAMAAGEAPKGVDYNKLLSISEAKTLGVAYGTTVGEAIEMGIIPSAEKEELLSPAEAERLGVPYGTTKSEAARESILFSTLEQWKTAGKSREEIEREYKSQNFVSVIPNEVSVVLDELFKPGWWEGTKQWVKGKTQEIRNWWSDLF